MKVAYGSTIAKFVLTSLLYGKSTFHMLWLVVQMNELMKQSAYSLYGRSGESVVRYCKDNELIGSDELKDLRSAVVHSICDVESLYADYTNVRVEYVMCFLHHFGVDTSNVDVVEEWRRCGEEIEALQYFE